jgi:hypothetical protein
LGEQLYTEFAIDAEVLRCVFDVVDYTSSRRVNSEDLLDSLLRKGQERTLFQVWVVHARTAQQNRLVKDKLRSLRVDMGGIAESMGPMDDAPASETEGVQASASENEGVQAPAPENEGVQAPAPESEKENAGVQARASEKDMQAPASADTASRVQQGRGTELASGLAMRRTLATLGELTVDVDEAQKANEAAELADARAEIHELRNEQAEAGRVVDAALAHCKRMGSELQERNREVAELRRRLGEYVAPRAEA